LAYVKPHSGIDLKHAGIYLAWACAVVAPLSIAASQILLGIALVALLVSRTPLRIPRIWPLLLLFCTGTVVSLLASGDPARGLPQIRKFYVYLTLIVVYSAFRTLAHVRSLLAGWAAAGSITAAAGIIQFTQKILEARRLKLNFYEFYMGARIKGFTSNWQTYAGEMMIVLLLLTALLMFWPRLRKGALWLGLAAAALTGSALLLNQTRGAWLATACALSYLLWCWKRRLLLALPVALAIVLWANPGSVRKRFISTFAPHGETDSNQQRIICWRTGWEMIRAHPWFGVGPEMVGPEFMRFVPADIQRPLPSGWYGHLHSVYVHYAAERGVAVMLAMAALLLKALGDFLGALRKLPPGPGEARAALHGAAAVVIGIMVAGVFELNLGDSEVLAMFLATLAAGYVAVDVAGSQTYRGSGNGAASEPKPA